MLLVSVIIVNYNTTNLLKNCLENLNKQSCKDLQIIVVDNASTDASLDRLKTAFPKVVFLLNKTNLGLAAANNQAFKLANGKYLFFLGTDAFPEQSVIEKLVTYMDNNQKVGICTCKLQLRNGALDRDAHRYFPEPLAVISYYLKLHKLFPLSKTLNKYYREYYDLEKIHEIDICLSHFMFTRKELFNEIGNWDEDYFLYAEDMDLCYRAKKSGWKIMYLPYCKAIHYKGASVGVRKTTKDICRAPLQQKIKMFFLSAKGLKLFYQKHYREIYPFFVIAPLIFAAYCRATLKSLKALLCL